MIEWNALRTTHGKSSRQTLHQTLLAQLGRMIQEGELSPGERLSEAALCERFDVSRTPLREALKVLAAEGYLVWIPNRGITVAEVRLDEVVHTFDLMSSLERLIGDTLCFRLTAEDLHGLEAMHAELHKLHAASSRTAYFRLNQQIHARLVALTRNPVLEDVYCSLQRRIYRARSLSNTAQLRWDESLREHDGFMAAMRRRDPALGDLLSAHSDATGAVIRSTLKCHTQQEAPADWPYSHKNMPE